MSTRLEQFIRENREHFDGDEPNPNVWNNVCRQIKQPHSKSIRMNLLRWSVAAAIVAVIGLTIFYMVIPGKINENTTGQGKEIATASNDILNDINPTYAKEVYHFTQLIELKQSELRQIGKENPELYRQFITDINKLDSSYNALKKELPANPNREQLLEAMIENLHLQAELLNQQLQIIKTIKQSKSKNNESNGKNI
jgi:hypothetical protein